MRVERAVHLQLGDERAEVLITECTFFDPAHKSKAKAGRHLHVDALAEVLPTLNNKHVVIAHVTRRTGIRRARGILRKKLGAERMANVHFLMDLDDAVPAGEVEDVGPPPADTAE